MYHQEIMDLLQEAADPLTSHTRAMQIFDSLNRALVAKKNKLQEQQKTCIKCAQKLLANLFIGALRHDRQALLGLFPLFDALCSNGSELTNIVSEIDWRLFVSAAARENSNQSP